METTQKKRKYQIAWETLKQTGELVLVAPVIVHPRIIKAIKKEKHQDAAFKLCNDHDYFFLEIKVDKQLKTKLIIKLRQRLGLEGVRSVPDPTSSAK